MASTRVAGSPDHAGASPMGTRDGELPQLLSPYPLRTGGAASPGDELVPGIAPSNASPDHRALADFRLKPRDVDARRVCGIAPLLLAADPSCEDALVCYAMLAAQRAQGYYRAAVWYQAATRALRLKPLPAFLRLCDESDHLALRCSSGGADTAASASQTPFPGATNAGGNAIVRSMSVGMGSESGGDATALTGGEARRASTSRSGCSDDDDDGDNNQERSERQGTAQRAPTSTRSEDGSAADVGDQHATDEHGATAQSPSKTTASVTVYSSEEHVRGTVLDLTDSYLGLRAKLAIISTIPLLTRLRVIRLARTQLDSTAVALLCHACRGLRYLTIVDVSHNPCSSLGAQALTELASRCRTITTIGVEGIEMIRPLFRRLEARLEANASAAAATAAQPNRAAGNSRRSDDCGDAGAASAEL